MESSQLRITNLVLYKDIECAVTGIDLVDIRISHFTDDTKQSSTIRVVNVYDDIKPIPLTEEWFMRFGFNRFEGVYVKTKKGGQQLIIEPTVNGFKFNYGYNDNFAFFNHVNQLQNLYFSLTNKELTIK